MATNIPVTLDTPITIKISIGELAKKIKLPLRDLSAEALPGKLKHLLNLPADRAVTFERFSDSAGGYVTLEASNPAVYKTLVRAAKAKLKLRLRAVVEETQQEKAVKAVASTAQAASSAKEIASDAVFANAVLTRNAYLTHLALAKSGLPLAEDKTSTDAGRSNVGAGIFEFKQGRASIEKAPLASVVGGTGEAPLPRSFDVPKPAFDPSDTQIRSILNTPVAPSSKLAVRTKPDGNVVEPLPYPYSATWSVYCNNCDAIMHDEHYHCSICDGGDYDLCQKCILDGTLCPGQGHWMVKRFIKDGQVVSSTTERLPPKPKQKTDTKPEPKPVLKAPCAPRPPPAPVAISSVLRTPPLRVNPFGGTPFGSAQVGRLTDSTPPGAFPEDFRGYRDEPYPTRTCNNCVNELSDANFVTCKACEDFDLCKKCHIANNHGHHPGHAFEVTVEGQRMTHHQKKLLPAGRGIRHCAICDGCDKHIEGVRHKCLDCPDFDYCNDCSAASVLTHPGHRFAPLYSPIPASRQNDAKHVGIYCDGAACTSKSNHSFIQGVRYKCVVCHDTDFCAVCEAHPGSTHNKTHPLLKITTPVRGLKVETLKEIVNETGPNKIVTCLGDHPRRLSARQAAKSSSPNAASSAKTMAHIAPTTGVAQGSTVLKIEDIHKEEDAKKVEVEEAKVEEAKVEEAKVEEAKVEEAKVEEAKVEEAEQPAVVSEAELAANFVCDIIPDGITVRDDSRFTQVWTMHNPGPLSWPAGCSVHFIGGDNMLNLNRESPFSAAVMAAATESNVTAREVAPGEHVAFKVVMKAPNRPGKAISYWRLKTADGLPFGHRLWCDINVRMGVTHPDCGPLLAKDPSSQAASSQKAEPPSASDDSTLTDSRMVFPTLDKESPAASSANIKTLVATSEDRVPAETIAVAATDDESEPDDGQDDLFEDISSEMETLSACSDFSDGDGFLTDEEYDILDASDQETVASHE